MEEWSRQIGDCEHALKEIISQSSKALNEIKETEGKYPRMKARFAQYKKEIDKLLYVGEEASGEKFRTALDTMKKEGFGEYFDEYTKGIRDNMRVNKFNVEQLFSKLIDDYNKENPSNASSGSGDEF